MIKQLTKSVAALLLAGTSALAADISGNYACQTTKGIVTVELHGEGSQLRGTFHLNGSDFPLSGQENGNNVAGSFGDNAGHMFGFAGAVDDNGNMSLSIGGISYPFQRVAANTAAPATQVANEAAAPQPMADAPTPDQIQMETRQGQSLQCDVPAGWQFNATNNGVDTLAPDGMTLMSKVFVHGVGRCTPDLFLQRMSRNWAALGITNVQVASEKVVGPSKVYEMDYLAHGRPAHAIVQASVEYGPGGGYLATMVTVQSSRESFQQALPVLVAMSKSVRVIDANAFADTGKIRNEQMKRNAIATKSAQDVGNIIINGERERGKIRDLGNLGASDTLRDVQRFQGPNGTQVTAPLQATGAYQNANGTYGYTTSNNPTVPAGATQLNQFNYRGQ